MTFKDLTPQDINKIAHLRIRLKKGEQINITLLDKNGTHEATIVDIIEGIHIWAICSIWFGPSTQLIPIQRILKKLPDPAEN